MTSSELVRAGALASVLFVPLWSCRGVEPQLESIFSRAAFEVPTQEWHVGPPVHFAPTGPARFAGLLHEAFRPGRAMDMVRFIDQYYRAPANEGYDAVLDRLIDELRAAGFDGSDERLVLEVLEEDELERAWTPRRASLTLRVAGEEQDVLHSFDSPEDADRVMLPVNTPSCDVTAEVALHLEDLRRGMILVTDVPASQVLRRARDRGAVAVVSASLYPFNEDPSGKERHLDAIQFKTLDAAESMPVVQISLRSYRRVEAAVERASKRGADVRMSYQAEVAFEERPMRTLVATVLGDERPGKAVAMVSHIQEPGASDNASGVAGLLESVRSLVASLKKGDLDWPAASLVFIWGDEFRQTELWLDRTELEPIAGISSDMTGQSKETGAIALLERSPDPGAITVLPPDAHTPWGAGRVDAKELKPDGMSILARCALLDVGKIEEGKWTTADHPWEGGSDHDIFIRRGLPACLFWHFTDFTYHTSLDRIRYVDPLEIRRTGVALLSTALALADPDPGDLERYLRTLDLEQEVRLSAAKVRGDEELERLWGDWFLGARAWLRNHCLGITEGLPNGK